MREFEGENPLHNSRNLPAMYSRDVAKPPQCSEAYSRIEGKILPNMIILQNHLVPTTTCYKNV